MPMPALLYADIIAASLLACCYTLFMPLLDAATPALCLLFSLLMLPMMPLIYGDAAAFARRMRRSCRC